MAAPRTALVVVLVIVAGAVGVRVLSHNDTPGLTTGAAVVDAVLGPRPPPPAPGPALQAALHFQAFHFINTAQREAWCRRHDVTLTRWTPAVDRAFAPEKAAADAILRREGQRLAGTQLTSRDTHQDAEVAMGRFAAERGLKGPEACAAMDADADALARALPFPPRMREALLTAR